jgi:hypothetical protein
MTVCRFPLSRESGLAGSRISDFAAPARPEPVPVEVAVHHEKLEAERRWPTITLAEHGPRLTTVSPAAIAEAPLAHRDMNASTPSEQHCGPRAAQRARGAPRSRTLGKGFYLRTAFTLGVVMMMTFFATVVCERIVVQVLAPLGADVVRWTVLVSGGVDGNVPYRSFTPAFTPDPSPGSRPRTAASIGSARRCRAASPG